jgi:hypothetical protein
MSHERGRLLKVNVFSFLEEEPYDYWHKFSKSRRHVLYSSICTSFCSSHDIIYTRDFFLSVYYAFLILAQRVDHAWTTRIKRSVINDVFNTRFKLFDFFNFFKLNNHLNNIQKFQNFYF